MFKLEDDVKDYIKDEFKELELKKNLDYNIESQMSEYMKISLKGASKTESKKGFGYPDFNIGKYRIPVVIEAKLGIKKLEAKTKDGVKFDDKSIRDYATNGSLYYAIQMIKSKRYKEVIAIGVAGDNQENIRIKVYYVYGASIKMIKLMPGYQTLGFLQNEKSFNSFYRDAVLSDDEKHGILIDNKTLLSDYSKKLNKLMHNHNITAPQRVLYVSGMLLSMQSIENQKGEFIKAGLTPDDLKGLQGDKSRDGIVIVNQIEEFLTERNISIEKRKLMLASFSEISKDKQRDELTTNDKEVAKFLEKESSCNKQIFTFIYEYIYKSIDTLNGHLDIMGEMYSEFLKYALGDGKEIGIVLTPPYVTKMMTEILGVNRTSKVMDLATGSAGFLISAMEVMIADSERVHGKNTSHAEQEIEKIKKEQLLGVELNAEMYTLATTNMILRGDGSSNIQKGNSFNRPEELYASFQADKLLLNPPFSFEENGMPFIEFGLNKMKKGGLGAIIIQDSAGSGKAIKTNQKILKNHTLLASIKMPTDLFIPMAGVQTSIYIFEAWNPHDFEKIVKFIDFRNDGYKRTKRGTSEIDSPSERYKEILKIYKAGKQARVNENLWNLDEVYVEDFITDSGADWNFEQHKIIDTKPKLEDFKKTVADYLAWEVEQVLKKGNDTMGKW